MNLLEKMKKYCKDVEEGLPEEELECVGCDGCGLEDYCHGVGPVEWDTDKMIDILKKPNPIFAIRKSKEFEEEMDRREKEYLDPASENE